MPLNYNFRPLSLELIGLEDSGRKQEGSRTGLQHSILLFLDIGFLSSLQKRPVQQDRDASPDVLIDLTSQQWKNTWGAINLILWWSAEHLLQGDSQGHSSLQPPSFLCIWSHVAYSQGHFAQRTGNKSETWFCNQNVLSKADDSWLRQLVWASQTLGRKLHPKEQTGIPALLGDLRECPKNITMVYFQSCTTQALLLDPDFCPLLWCIFLLP